MRRQITSIPIFLNAASRAVRCLAFVVLVVLPQGSLQADAACSCGDAVCTHGGQCSDNGEGILAGYWSDCLDAAGWTGDGAAYCGNLVPAAGGCASGEELVWFRADYARWRRDGVELPPLATSSLPNTPPNQQGVLGLPTTTILAGDGLVGDGWRNGFGFEMGFWLNAYSNWALVADFFNAGRDSYAFEFGPGGPQVLARPFLNAQTGQQNAVLSNLPNELRGGISGNVFDDFHGAGFWMQRAIWERGSPCTSEGGARLTMLGGYRFYHHDSLVFVREDYIALAGNSFGFEPGAIHLSYDKFAGQNEFHGFEIGLQGRFQRCRWWAEGLATVALGGTRRSVFVEGLTFNADPDVVTLVDQGSLLTSGVTNIGQRIDDQAQAIPRFRLGAGWQITEKLSIRGGYNVIIWDGIVQGADHIPPQLRSDPRNLPTVQPGGGPHPIFPGIRDTQMIAHGLDLGLELWF